MSHQYTPRPPPAGNGTFQHLPPINPPGRSPGSPGRPAAAASGDFRPSGAATARPTAGLPPPQPAAAATQRSVRPGAREDRKQYLRRPDVAQVMDELVSRCLEDMPDDPANYILHHLEERVGRSSSSMSGATSATGSAVLTASTHAPAPGGNAVQQPSANGAAEGLLQWLVDNQKVAVGDPSELPEAAKGHPLAAAVVAIQQRLQLDNETNTVHSEDDVVTAVPEAQRMPLIRSVTRATQALVGAGADPHRALKSLAAALRDLVDADRCTVFMADERRRTISGTVDGKLLTLPFGRGIAGTCAANGKSIRIARAYEDSRFNPGVDIDVSYVTKSLLTVPMHVDGKLIAVVQLVNKKPIDSGAEFSAEDEYVLDSFTRVAGASIRNSMFYAEVTRISHQNEMIANINTQLANSELAESKLIPSIVRGAKEIVGADRCAFFKVADDGHTLVAHLEGVYARIRLSTDQGIVGHVARNRESLNIADAYQDARFNREVDQASGYKTESILCFPIFANNDLVAIAQLVNKQAPANGGIIPFDKRDEEVVQAFAQAAGVCMRNCQMHTEMQEQQNRLQAVARIATFISSAESEITKPEGILTFIADTIVESARAGAVMFYKMIETDSSAPHVYLIAKSQHASRHTKTQRHGEKPMCPAVSQVPGVPVVQDHGSDGDEPPLIHGLNGSGDADGDCASPVCHVLGSGVVASLVGSSKPIWIRSQRDMANLEPELFQAEGRLPESLLVVPIMDSGVSVGCAVIVDADASIAEGIVASGSVSSRKGSSAMLKQLTSLSSLKSPELVSSDIKIAISMAGFALRVAHVLEVANRHGNNLAALMELESMQECLKDDQDSEAALMSSSTVAGLTTSLSTASRAYPAPDELELNVLSSLEFDIHKYRHGDAPVAQLIVLIRTMLTDLKLLDAVQVPETRLMRFLGAIKLKYRDVPYHNFYHAFDVTQTVFTFIKMAGLDIVLQPEEMFSVLVACVCHDVDHMGLNNAFHLRAETPLGILTSVSGQKSVLEVHHCQITIDLIGKTRLLNDADREARTRIQKTMVNCILATDMALHRDKVNEIDAEIGNGKFDPNNEQHRHLVLVMLLKMADISNVVKPFDISRQWGLAVTEEFYRQGDQERDQGLEVTPMFDRERKVELAKGQIGFITAVGVPFFRVAASAFPVFEKLVETAELNIGHWRRVLEATSSSAAAPQ